MNAISNLKLRSTVAALPRTRVASLSIPRERRLSRIIPIARALRSMRTTRFAPRLNASMPTAPLPAYASKNVLPSSVGANTLNSASRSRSGVGRTARPGTLFSVRLRSRPEITLKLSTHLDQPVSALPVLLNVPDDAGELFACVASVHSTCFDEVPRLAPGRL
jgi:hypothetical protein